MGAVLSRKSCCCCECLGHLFGLPRLEEQCLSRPPPVRLNQCKRRQSKKRSCFHRQSKVPSENYSACEGGALIEPARFH